MNDPRQLLAARRLRPKKSFGQNFLVVPHYVDAIADACLQGGEGEHPLVIEFGAGTGVLTAALLARGAHVVAIERDRDLVPLLEQEFAQAIAEGRLTVVEADAKNANLAELARERGRERCVLAGNVPYQITGALIELATKQREVLTGVVFLVQKEVADRLIASEGDDAYGALTVFVAAQFVARRVTHVPRSAFFPAPEVDSSVVAFAPRQPPLSEETPELQQVVRGAFSQRRKKLRNAWKQLASSEELASLAERCGVSLDQRGEELSPATFAAVAQALVEHRRSQRD